MAATATPPTTSYRFKPVVQASNRSNLDYELSVRQQPKQARMCGSGEKADRRPIDPPPIIRLRIRDRTRPPNAPENTALIQSPFYFMFASICTTDSDEELFTVGTSKSRYLTGSVVSSLYHLRDPVDNIYSAFFVFPDIGVRVEGKYRFKLTMYEICGQTVERCALVFTDVFDVYSAKRFPGMEGSTELSKSFAEQGIRIRIRRPIRLRRRAPNDQQGNGQQGGGGSKSETEPPTAKRARTVDAHPGYPGMPIPGDPNMPYYGGMPPGMPYGMPQFSSFPPPSGQHYGGYAPPPQNGQPPMQHFMQPPGWPQPSPTPQPPQQEQRRPGSSHAPSPVPPPPHSMPPSPYGYPAFPSPSYGQSPGPSPQQRPPQMYAYAPPGQPYYGLPSRPPGSSGSPSQQQPPSAFPLPNNGNGGYGGFYPPYYPPPPGSAGGGSTAAEIAAAVMAAGSPEASNGDSPSKRQHEPDIDPALQAGGGSADPEDEEADYVNPLGDKQLPRSNSLAALLN